MFLIGGPPFSGTTLLALLLNQGNLVCLDEPDFHNPKQSHRGIPFLRRIFPDKNFPEDPKRSLSYEESTRLAEQCETSIAPMKLGIKTCNLLFIELAKIYRSAGYPVIAVIRDIRDALVNPLPEWTTEKEMNSMYRLIWNHLNLYNDWIRYENLVLEPEEQMEKIAHVLSCRLKVPERWESKTVPGTMLKLPRHQLLQSGNISKDRIGIWRNSGKSFSDETHDTAELMGYAK